MVVFLSLVGEIVGRLYAGESHAVRREMTDRGSGPSRDVLCLCRWEAV